MCGVELGGFFDVIALDDRPSEVALEKVLQAEENDFIKAAPPTFEIGVDPLGPRWVLEPMRGFVAVCEEDSIVADHRLLLALFLVAAMPERRVCFSRRRVPVNLRWPGGGSGVHLCGDLDTMASGVPMRAFVSSILASLVAAILLFSLAVPARSHGDLGHFSVTAWAIAELPDGELKD